MAETAKNGFKCLKMHVNVYSPKRATNAKNEPNGQIMAKFKKNKFNNFSGSQLPQKIDTVGWNS